MASPYSVAQGRRAGVHHCSGSPHRQANTLPSHVPDFHQTPVLNPSMPRLSTHCAPQLSCVLSMAHDQDSKFQILKDWTMHGPTPSHRGELCRAAPCAVLPQKSSPMVEQVSRVYGETQRKAALSTLCTCLCLLLLNCHSKVPAKSFVLG